jgi:hypothetical protein
MTVDYVADHSARGVALLTDRFRQPIISALLTSWLDEVQELEDVFADLLARGIWVPLDRVGRIVGQPREGRDDTTYLAWILARVLVNRSSGKTEQIIALAKKLGLGVPVRVEEQYPAAATVHFEQPIGAQNGVQIAKLMQLAKAVGVRVFVEWAAVAPVFRFAAGTAPELSSPHGFGVGKFAAISIGGDVEFAEG